MEEKKYTPDGAMKLAKKWAKKEPFVAIESRAGMFFIRNDVKKIKSWKLVGAILYGGKLYKDSKYWKSLKEVK